MAAKRKSKPAKKKPAKKSMAKKSPAKRSRSKKSEYRGKTVAKPKFGGKKFDCRGKRVKAGKGSGEVPRVFCSRMKPKK